MTGEFRSRVQGLALAGTLAFSLVLSGCTLEASEDSNGETTTVTHTSQITTEPPVHSEQEVEEPSASAAPSEDSGSVEEQLQAAVEQTVGLYGGTAGIAFSDGISEISAGDMTAYAAWSTIKVPIAIAALRQDPSQTDNVTAAIQRSDNAAAEALWASLGDPASAGAATSSVLSEGGVGIPVNTVVTRDGFSSFGQTMWSTSDQARFAANLGCIAGSDPVLQDMAMVDPSQSWGIGQLTGAQFKGGWGPEPNGAYSARQFGVFTDPSTGQTRALAISVRPGSGDFGEAQSMANALISHIQGALPEIPANNC